MNESVLLETGERAIVATVSGGDPSVFQSTHLQFIRPRWTEDNEVTSCLLCKNKFSQLRRKHHCRSCGWVFCSKCCNAKMMLPHLGFTEAERVCEICRPIAHLLELSHSHSQAHKMEAATGLCQMVQKRINMQEVLELGGLQTLVWLCGDENPETHKQTIAALHILATQSALLKYLFQAGIVKALTSILSRTEGELQTDCISTLLILSNETKHIPQIIQDGGLTILMTKVSRVDDLTRLLTLQTIMRLSENTQSHDKIMADLTLIKYLVSLTTNFSDIQVATLIFRVFCNISSKGDVRHCTTLAQVEATSTYLSRNLSLVTGDVTQNSEALKFLACLVANIAAHESCQIHLAAVASKLSSLINEANMASNIHILRAIANITFYPNNSTTLTNAVKPVIGLLSSCEPMRSLALRTVINLLRHNPAITVQQLIRSPDKFLRALSGSDQIMIALAEAAAVSTDKIMTP